MPASSTPGAASATANAPATNPLFDSDTSLGVAATLEESYEEALAKAAARLVLARRQ